MRVEVARRAGIKLEPGEEPGPLDLGDRSVRSALRELYAQRFGDAELDKQKKAAESAAPAPAAASAAGAPEAKAALPIWQRVGRMIQGEPQVADPTAFYNALRDRLNREQPLPADALARLGAQRAEAIVAALKETGVDPARAVTSPPEKIEAAGGKAIPLKLGHSAAR